MTWPHRDRVKSGARLRMRIRMRSEVGRIYVDSFRSIRRNGKPRDRGKDIQAHKHAVKHDGRVVAWDVVFRLYARRVHYVRVLIQSPHTVAWNLHVRAVD